jgi:hypothetical protein
MKPFQLTYLASNLFAIGVLMAAWVRPRWARAATVILFFVAFTFNTRQAVLAPAVYQRFWGFARLQWYRDFISGPFANHTRAFLLPIAAGQLAIALLLMGSRRLQIVGVVGATIFLLAISPLGKAAAFPFSITYTGALWVMVARTHRAHFEESDNPN